VLQMQPTEILTLSPVLAYRVSRRLACTVKQFYSCKNPTAFTPFRPGQIAIIVMNRTQVLIKYLNSTELTWKHHPEGRTPRPMFLGIRCDALGSFARCSPLLLSSRHPESILYQRRDGDPANGNVNKDI
jgi:hypothetical protein